MDIKQVADILNDEGRKVDYNNTSIYDLNAPFENYYKVEKNGGNWAYGLVKVERTDQSEFHKKRTFEHQEEAIKFYLLKRLSEYYDETIISSFKSEDKGLGFGTSKFGLNEMARALQTAQIKKFFSIDDKITDNFYITLVKDNNNEYKVALKQGEDIIHSTIPIELERALIVAFRKTYLLYLYKTRFQSLLEQKGILGDYDVNDLKTFIS